MLDGPSDAGSAHRVTVELPSTRLALTGTFELAGPAGSIPMPHSAERLLAFLALGRGWMDRARAWGLLWPDGTAGSAARNLRTALWRVQQVGPGLVDTSGSRLRLAPRVSVDVHELVDLARRLVHHPDEATLARVPALTRDVEILPDWDDEWIVADRERLRLLRLEALDAAASVLLERDRLVDALLAAQTAVDAEPLRESSLRLVVRSHLARGNVAEAMRSYHSYRRLLREELHTEPSTAMQHLVAPWRRSLVAR